MKPSVHSKNRPPDDKLDKKRGEMSEFSLG
jgi:hypothetical protein